MIGACQKSALWWQIRIRDDIRSSLRCKNFIKFVILLRNCRNGPHQVFSGKIGQAVEARMRTRAMQRSKCTIVLKVFATRTAWDFHNVIPTDHRSFLKCKVLFGMSIKGIVKIERKKNWPNFFCQYCQPAKNQPKSHFILFLKMAPCATFM